MPSANPQSPHHTVLEQRGFHRKGRSMPGCFCRFWCLPCSLFTLLCSVPHLTVARSIGFLIDFKLILNHNYIQHISRKVSASAGNTSYSRKTQKSSLLLVIMSDAYGDFQFLKKHFATTEAYKIHFEIPQDMRQ